MAGFSQTMAILSSGMRGQSQRIGHISENIANADTPGYRRKTIDFRAEVVDGRRSGAVETGAVRLDRAELHRIHEPSHPMADDEGYYFGSNVDLVTELADAREAQRSYEANLKMFEQVRRMSSAVMDIIKR
ncbi:flagellar basal body rod protein FlgC [Jannaschia pagri]|uniref:Flagellar basal body rod protein FlgC n=1 Tax=Jannaschia pagri TaxID=2829797 RepID=A0ABQ4NM18_9RHOB|nr:MULTISPECIES: flagellar basal body rod protein FlgC [unclassified Jannaschia]GIT91621.1 flagellar basal body rod protein FlgC [Jannaschia sp. AI_61]GIT95455.1 flagellar basal body rod protein FlgC [Jannaschia sp. AI_62]